MAFLCFTSNAAFNPCIRRRSRSLLSRRRKFLSLAEVPVLFLFDTIKELNPESEVPCLFAVDSLGSPCTIVRSFERLGDDPFSEIVLVS